MSFSPSDPLLTVEEIIRIHRQLVAEFGGLEGVRDKNALESACARLQTGYYSDLLEEAAALFESLSQNHPFLDGNKRTAITAVAMFLEYNGHELWVDSLTAYHWLIQRYESGTMKKAAIEHWLREYVTQL